MAQAGPITGRAAQRHRIALLALLSTTSRLFRSRDQLVAFLWPDADAERGRKLLSDSIYRINQALGADAITGAGEDVRLNRTVVGSDVADFEAAVEARDWRRAIEVYAGPFLDGFFLPGASEFDQWLENERAQYARTAAKALEALAVDARDAGRVAEAVDWWQRLAAVSPDDSRVAMELMRSLEASGNRAAALRHARVHSVLLRETLGVEPDRSVRELADQIAGRDEAPAIPVVAPATDTTPVVALPAATPMLGGAIAVLPFNNVSDSDSNAYFADGVSEELMYLLTRTAALRVASRTSAFAYRDLKLDVRELARRLDVDWILEGSVRRSDDRLRIVARLTDARNGYQVWSEAFDRTSSDVFAIQAEIAGAIVNRLAPAMGGSVGIIPAVAREPADPQTYDLYLQARFHWHRRTDESLRKSARLFEQVVARDPEYARAWSGLADAYACIAFYDYLAPQDAFPRVESAARHAILLDPTLAAPYAALAYVDTYYHLNWAAAEDGFRRAIELEPTYSPAHQWYGNLLTVRGQFDEAEREIRRAAELDPLSMIAHAALAWVFIYSTQHDRAIQQLESVLEMDPKFCLAHFWMGLALERQGRLVEATASLRRASEIARGCFLVLAALARVHALAGDVDSACEILDHLLEQERGGRYISSYDIGRVYHALGDIPASLARLERAYDDRAHSLALLNVDPQLRPLAADPRFKRLVERVGEPQV